MSAARLPDSSEEAVRLYERMLARGPVPCRVVGARAAGLQIPPGAQAQARRLLGVEVVRDADGVALYRLPE